MLGFVDNRSLEFPMDNMDTFRSLRFSNEVWNKFQEESTSAEFALMELIWEIYECRCEIVHGTSNKLQLLAKNLSERVPFDGLDANDISWDPLHATLLTVRV
jgi:hypothetical protein